MTATHSAPLSPAVFHILLALWGKERHGYDIMRQISEDTDGTLTMGPGTLYGSIDRMMEAGLVERSPKRDEPRRIYYRLTAKGKTVLRTETERLRHAAAIAAERHVA